MKKKSAIIILVYLILIGAVLSFIPPVEQLGTFVRLIIFHGILSIAGLYAIYAAGVLGLIHLLSNKQWPGLWSREVGWIAVFVWLVGFLLSLVSMQVAWGGMMWEPRTVAAVTIVMLGFGKEYLVRTGGGKIRAFALANSAYAAAVVLIRQTLVFVMHPENPTGTSDSMLIRLLPWLMVLFTLVAVFEIARQRLAQRVD